MWYKCANIQMYQQTYISSSNSTGWGSLWLALITQRSWVVSPSPKLLRFACTSGSLRVLAEKKAYRSVGVYAHPSFLLTPHYAGYYFTGDGVYRDADGHLQITGRVDDVIKIKGRRIGTAELERALVSRA